MIDRTFSYVLIRSRRAGVPLADTLVSALDACPRIAVCDRDPDRPGEMLVLVAAKHPDEACAEVARAAEACLGPLSGLELGQLLVRSGRWTYRRQPCRSSVAAA